VSHLALRGALVCSLVLSLVVIGGASALPPNGPSPNLVISQLYGAGGNSGAVLNEDYIELFNRGASPQSVNGWSVQYTSSTGTGNFGTAGLTALPNATVPAGGYLLIGEATGTNGSALPTPDATGTINMAAGAGKVALVSDATALGCNGSSTPCSAAQAARIVDLVGYGSGTNYFEGSGPTPTISATTAAFRAQHGCQDTDDNAADFATGAPAPRNSSTAPNPCGGGGAPTSPAVSGAASPASVDAGATTLLTARVTPGTNPASSGLAVTGDLSSLGGSATQTFYDDGTHGDVTAGDNTFSYSESVPSGTSPGAKTIPLTVSDAQGRNGSGSIALTVTTPPPFEQIHDIQGTRFQSPFTGQRVSTSGIVTALDTDGFYLQDPTPDSNDATSEGVFVFTSSAPHVAVGDAANVTATVAEFLPGGSSGASNLTITELDSPSVTVTSSGNALPPPVVIGVDRTPPTQVIDTPETGDANTEAALQPARDGLDFWESLEGMRLEVDDAVAVGPTNEFGETEVVSSASVPASQRTPSGGVVVTATNFNPERIVVDDGLESLPEMNTGDHYTSPLIGPLTYDFDNFYLEPDNGTPTVVHDGAQRTSTTQAGPDQLSVATFNVENLAPSDPASKFSALANIVVNNLKAPDVIAVEEVQDNDGATDDGVVAANVTISDLESAIQTAGGPSYDAREIDPVNDQDGGQPGGNIRVVFLFRTDRGLSFVNTPAGAGDSTTADSYDPSTGNLVYNPGRVDPGSSAWAASRKPLAGEFMFRGQKVFVIANHWVAKLPDDPLEGHVQPPQQPSETQRLQQANEVKSFTQSILASNPNANVVVLGDLNDMQFSDSVQTLDSTPLHDLITTLPANEQYTYVYEGNSEVLDHILVSDNLFDAGFDYDVVHVNSEFDDQVSDHDPQVVHLTFDRAPTVSAGGPYMTNEGGPVTLTATGSDPDGDALTYQWDTNGDGVYDHTGQSVTITPDDGPATIHVTVQATDPYGQSDTDTTTLTVNNVAPTGTFHAPSSATLGGTFTLSITNPSDPSNADTTAGFAYAFDCGSGYGAFTPSSTATCQAGTSGGTLPVGGKIRDKDGGVTEYRGSVAVDDPFADVCTLARSYSSQKLVADAICAELAAARDEQLHGHPVLRDVDLALADLTVALSPRAFTHAEQQTLYNRIDALAS
jgi:uncharacterized protein